MPLTTAALPVIDLTLLDSEDTREAFYKELGYLSRDVGFFYVVGHGVDPAEREEMLVLAKQFFALPQEQKDAIDMSNSRHFRGYTKTGGEQTRDRPDIREQIDIGYESEAIADIPDDALWLYMIGPNQWPAEVPELKASAIAYQAKVRAVTLKLLRAFMVALGQPEDALHHIFDGTPQHLLKLVHYPPNLGTEGGSKDASQGVGPHRDVDFLTLLWQDDIGGLQVETEKGWIDIPYIENSFVVNIGEQLELATNGYLRANVHQVLRPISNRSRYSIPFFIVAGLHVEAIPLLELPAELKKRSRGKSSDPLNPLFQNPGKNTIKSRFRSHRAVTERFYPEQFLEVQAKSNIS